MGMKKDDILKRLKESKVSLAKDFGIDTIGLFGSYAKDQASENSDIDLLYKPKEGVTIGFEKRILLEEYLIKALENPKIDLVNYKYINPIVKKDMEKDVIYV